MATLETQIVDDLIVKSRRKMLTLGGTALAGLALAGTKSAQAQSTTIGDNDILNFALNLEFLEANFYYLAAFGTTIDVSNSYSTGAGGPSAGIPLTGSGSGTQGTVTVQPAGAAACKVPFTTTAIGSYAFETAIEEGKHVLFLQSVLGSSAVPQPAIDLYTSFNNLAMAAGIAATFNPFASDATFLVGAFIFEDVGVTAYHGAAPLFTQTATGKTYLDKAAGILAVEAYHAGLVRTAINNLDPTYVGIGGYTQKIAALRAKLSLAALSTAPNPDDFGVEAQTVSLNGTPTTATTLVDADPTNVIAFSRNTTQVLNIVTGGMAGTTSAPVSPAKGIFFPAGMNGLIK